MSIVTPSLNQARFVDATLRSVRRQDYPHIEHIVVDGGSTDGSLEIFERHRESITLISEPDRGQAHAINKGFDRAQGEILGWLNADDLYATGAVRRIVEFFERRPDAGFAYGDAEAIDERDRSYGLRVNVGAGGLRELIEESDFIVQPAAFWRAEVWNEIGPLDEGLCYALDYEYWMRVARRCSLHHLPICLARERIHASAKTSGGGAARIEELRRISRRHGGNGIPRAFRSEAGATYLLRGLSRCLRGRVREGLGDVRQGLGLADSIVKTSAYLAVALLLGRRRIARARLWSNWLRSRRASRRPRAAAATPGGRE